MVQHFITESNFFCRRRTPRFSELASLVVIWVVVCPSGGRGGRRRRRRQAAPDARRTNPPGGNRFLQNSRSRSGPPLAGAPPHAGVPSLVCLSSSSSCSCLSGGSPSLRGQKDFASSKGRSAFEFDRQETPPPRAALRPYVPRVQMPA